MQVVAELERGRTAYEGRAWLEAYEALSRGAELAVDLELLARSAYMLGRDDDYVAALERAHDLYLAEGETQRAVRCAFWIGHSMLFRRRLTHARGWFARAKRELESRLGDCAERGYLLIPVWLEQMSAGDFAEGYATAAEAAAIGERFDDTDLIWLARDEQGRALVKQGRVKDGLRLVDEVMVAAAGDELSPVVAGIVYCNTIAFCRDVYELRHAREWTEALTAWCAGQPEMVAHNGLCLVHRAEILQLQGAWDEAASEAEQAAQRFTQGALNELACGRACYRAGEIHRLRGRFAAAEESFRTASRCGYEPQPGLALLRLAQGNRVDAAGAIHRALGEERDPFRRAELLPAAVEVMLASGEPEDARLAVGELEETAERQGTDVLLAMAAQARGVVALAEGDAQQGLPALRAALDVWQTLGAPYETARTRMSIGLACRSLRDEETAVLELEAARDIFMRLRARPDLAHVETLLGKGYREVPYGLTDRELQVLRLVAAGRSNREIGAALVISEHTVARHVQNIFGKLGVSSRSAAGAFAFSHDLV